MRPNVRASRWMVAAALSGVVIAACSSRKSQTSAVQPPPPPPPHAAPQLVNDSPFAPAFTHLDERAQKIDVATLGDAVQCSGCHADVVSQWDVSAHHASSFTNRFYAAAIDLTRKQRGNKASRWCAGCHDPSLLLDGSIDGEHPQADPRAGDGVGCLLCHETSASSRLGGGGFTLAWTGFKEPDPKSVASIAEHKKAMNPSQAMGEGEFCASCHKVSIHADVNGKRWFRGQNDFDAWEQGPYALGGEKTAGVIYAPDVEATTCQQCHMQKEDVTQGDLAGKPSPSGKKQVKSHRFLGANTALPAFAHDAGTVEAQRKMLEGAVRVDVMAVRMSGAPMKAIEIEDAKVQAGSTFSFDVVVENERVGHKFPGGTSDSNEAWLAVDVRDASGKVVAQSGALDKNDALSAEAHKFGVLALDGEGKPATQRDAHRFVAIGWDTTIGPKDARVVRYGLHVPDGVALPLSIDARVLYRKFSAEYASLACTSKAASLPPSTSCPRLPIVEVSRDVATLGAPHASTTAAWKRYDAYGRGLLQALQEEVGDAAPILQRAIALAPERAEAYVDLSRLFIRQGRTDDAMAALDLAQKLDPRTPVVPFLRGLSRYETYKLGDGVEPLRLAVERAPKSLMAAELLGEGLELKGDDLAAIDVVHKALLVDPEDAQLRHLEALAFDKLGMKDDAQLAEAAYLEYRADDDRPKLRSICKAKVEGCAREANPLHTHDLVMMK